MTAAMDGDEDDARTTTTTSSDDEDVRIRRRRDDDDDDDDASVAKANGTGDLDDARDGRPTWFDARAFERDDFDPWEYVEEITTFVGSETLREALDGHERETREALERLVNENYEEFASLGDDLRDYAELRDKIMPGQIETKREVSEGREEIVRALERLEASAEEREAQARASASKRLADECGHTVSKVERLLGELDVVGGKSSASDGATGGERAGDLLASVVIGAEDREGLEMLAPAFEDDQATPSGAETDDMHREHISGDVNERARMLDRISSEVNRLKFYQKQGKDLSAIRDLADRIEYCELKLTSLAQTALIDGLKEKNANVISHCLHGCTAIGKFDVVESAIRTVLIRPAVEKTLESIAEEDFASVLPKLSETALTSCSYVLDLTRVAESGLQSHDFLAGTVLAEVDSQLSSAFEKAYSPGIPQDFIKNYRAAMKFVDILEDLAPTMASLNHFRASRYLESYMKRWNLSVYFNLRFQEFACDVDEELNEPGLDTSRASDGFLLTPTTQTWLTMAKCMAEEVFVPALTDKFIRLFAQVLSRYRTWVKAGIEALSVQQSSDSNAEEGKVTMVTSSSSWGATAGGDELILVRLDVEKLCAKVRSDGAACVKASTSILGEDTAQIAVDCVLEGANELQEIIPQLDAFIVKVYVERCVESLKQLKGITATFRMTNKPMPTRHSHFVPTILAPLQAFLDNERTKMFSKTSRQEIVDKVVDSVSERYAEMASDLVATVKKTEASLNRLKDRQGKTSSTGVGDTDKICRQLYLDAKEYAVQMEKFGVVSTNSDAFNELWSNVAAGAPTA
jgi:hypothetical protein